MKAEKILVPTDFTECSRAALEMATTLALETGAKLLIVHAEEPPLVYRGQEMYLGYDRAWCGPPQRVKQDVERRLAEVVPQHPDVEYEHQALVGEPAAAIVHAAECEQVDLIVIATHGWRGLKRMLLGSVAEKVVRTAPCPVVTVKPPRASPLLRSV